MKRYLIFLVCVIALGFALETFLNSYIQAVFISFMINAIMALSLNFITGLADQFSLGHAGLMAIGAYTAALINKEFLNSEWYMIPVGVLAAAFVAAFAGYLISLPSFRLKGDYLAIVTMGMAEIVRVVLLNWDYVGGPRGYMGIAKFPSFLLSYGFAAILLTFTFLTMYRLKFSWFGRNLWAINEDDIAAEVMGLNVAKTKRRAFVISSFFAGLGGGFYAHHLGFISPGSFGFIISVQILIFAVFGGLGSLTGSVIAALFLTFLPEALRSVQIGNLDLRMIIFPILLILMMILRPQGLLGRKEFNLESFSFKNIRMGKPNE
ncbi:branched-chain amino acid ABC transporter permease [Pseudobdellovibrio exovorus]|uniref:Branched-chain amino acid ABC transporter, permease protein n=1 Tax=Pseudobdellovibrio exovorus JSS TaxID=1184267 RepID=M4VAA8_9BACT|nr:branched-chain amino acid ABC transporter permease [Pseudobdellovibrio exovorus]AGH96342.1 branched-chain amino acid ABC transporter, permease protein [Pseudobdellovibrio exovorus JSS]